MDPATDDLDTEQQRALGKLTALDDAAAAEVVARWLHLTDYNDTLITERRDELDEEAESDGDEDGAVDPLPEA